MEGKDWQNDGGQNHVEGDFRKMILPTLFGMRRVGHGFHGLSRIGDSWVSDGAPVCDRLTISKPEWPASATDHADIPLFRLPKAGHRPALRDVANLIASWFDCPTPPKTAENRQALNWLCLFDLIRPRTCLLGRKEIPAIQPGGESQVRSSRWWKIG